jgi:chemotaxis signal transduction protein
MDASESADTLQRAERARLIRDGEVRATTVAVLTFVWDGGLYGLPLPSVREVARVGTITPVPGLPPSLPGVVNLRGDLLPVADVRPILGLAPSQPGATSRLVVVPHLAERVGILTDAVGDIVEVTPADRPTGEAGGLLSGQVVLASGHLLSMRVLARLTES